MTSQYPSGPVRPHRRHLWPLLAVTLAAGVGLPAQDQKRDAADTRREEVEDYYQKWLKQDVVYIITDEERAVFNQLATPEEKEQFIEQFWFRRDPDPRTAINEFKEEHYRRIAYANEKFTSGDPGWRTDRGRIYIIHGPPDTIETRPMGGVYNRPIEEGGGTTAVHPYEKWRYRYLEGIGQDVELEFVDTTGSGDYKLAVFYWEKDALMMSPGAGKTLAEETGLATRADRPALTPAAGGALYGPQNWYRRANDAPFARYELFAKVGAAPITKYADLKELVKVNVSFDTLPFQAETAFFKLNEAQVLVPLTVQVKNSDLNFKREDQLQVARVAVYGIVSTMTNRIVTEFEDDFVVRYNDAEMQKGLLKTSVYQKIFPVESRGRYKVDLVLKDVNTGKTGVLRMPIIPPGFSEQELQGSSLLLSDSIKVLNEIPEQDEMFVIGDVRVLPRLDHKFSPGMPLGLYYQVYNVALDQTTLEPSLRVTYNLFRNGQLLASAVDERGESTQYFSGRRVVLTKLLSLEGLERGEYQVEIQVEDRLSNRTLKQRESFSIVEG